MTRPTPREAADAQAIADLRYAVAALTGDVQHAGVIERLSRFTDRLALAAATETTDRAALIPSIEVALFTRTPEQHACLDREVLGGLVHRLLERWAGRESVGMLHRAPHGGIAPFECCGLTPLDVPEVDRITWTDDLVTCTGAPAAAGPRAGRAGGDGR